VARLRTEYTFALSYYSGTYLKFSPAFSAYTPNLPASPHRMFFARRIYLVLHGTFEGTTNALSHLHRIPMNPEGLFANRAYTFQLLISYGTLAGFAHVVSRLPS